MTEFKDITKLEIPEGFCQCGCNQKTSIAKRSWFKRNIIKGHPLRFIPGHIGGVGVKNPNWKGGKHVRNGYVMVRAPKHPHATYNHYVREHILIAEKVMGRFLNKREEIHHVDGNCQNNDHDNLVICEDHSYHMLIEARTRAYLACGNANWKKCPFCKKYDDSDNMEKISLDKRGCNDAYQHKECRSAYSKEWYNRKRLS